MESVLSRPVLTLNRNWSPINTVSVADAICKVFSNRARIVDPETYNTFDFDSWAARGLEQGEAKIRSVGLVIGAPNVIVLLSYERMPPKKVLLSRRNIYKRDRYRCQYCGSTPGSRELSIDHVVPKAQGGTTSWTNCVIACTECNKRKGHMGLKGSGLRLLKEPAEPTWHIRYAVRAKEMPASWSHFISDAYWNVELDED